MTTWIVKDHGLKPVAIKAANCSLDHGCLVFSERRGMPQRFIAAGQWTSVDREE